MFFDAKRSDLAANIVALSTTVAVLQKAAAEFGTGDRQEPRNEWEAQNKKEQSC